MVVLQVAWSSEFGEDIAADVGGISIDARCGYPTARDIQLIRKNRLQLWINY